MTLYTHTRTRARTHTCPRHKPFLTPQVLVWGLFSRVKVRSEFPEGMETLRVREWCGQKFRLPINDVCLQCN